MSTKNRNTYQGWILEGKAVRAGERAVEYAVVDEKPVAVFHLNQVEDLELVDLLGCTFITRDEKEDRWGAPGTKKKHVKLDVEPYKPGKVRLLIWAGNNVDMIRWLKAADYKYSGSLHRWAALRDEDKVDDIIKALEAKDLEVRVTRKDTI